MAELDEIEKQNEAADEDRHLIGQGPLEEFLRELRLP